MAILGDKAFPGTLSQHPTGQDWSDATLGHKEAEDAAGHITHSNKTGVMLRKS